MSWLFQQHQIKYQ